MATPRNNHTARYPGDKDPANPQHARRESDNRFIKLASDYNLHDAILQAIMCFVGFDENFDPTGPATGPDGKTPGSGSTIIERIIRIGGTGYCLDDGDIWNYGGTYGVDPGGLNLSKTGEPALDPIVNPPDGWIPLNPVDPSGIVCPEFPTPPPPPWPVPPGYPDYNPDNSDTYPFGPWMQYVSWAIAAQQAAWQVQNAQNINLGPGGMVRAGFPAPWLDLMRSGQLYPLTTTEMVPTPGLTIPDFDTTNMVSVWDAVSTLMNFVTGMAGMLGFEWHVFDAEDPQQAYIETSGIIGINTGTVSIAEDANAAEHLVYIVADNGVTYLPTDILPAGGGSTQVGLGAITGDIRILLDGTPPAGTKIGVCFLYVANAAEGTLGPLVGAQGADNIVWNELGTIGPATTVTTGSGDNIKDDARVIAFDNGAFVDPTTYTISGATLSGPTWTGPVYLTYQIDDC